MTDPAQDSESSLANRFTRAVVFVNVHSGRGKSRRRLPLFVQVFRAYGIAVEIIETSSAEDLAVQAEQQIRAGAQLLFSAGGDGTCQGLVNSAFGHNVVLGLIPAGGGNDFARALGLPQNPIAALQASLAGEPRAIDLVKVRTGDGRERLYLGGGGIGLDAATAHLASTRYRNWPGRTRYVASAIRAYASCVPIRIRISLESDPHESAWESALFACVLNTPTFGAGIRIVPTAKIDDGVLNLAVLDDLRIGRLLRLLPQLALRGTVNLPALRTVTVRKLRIETDAPNLFQGDGELLGPTPVDIEIVPGATRFLAPRPPKH
jgi:diacylglycerol kinase (ATP)